MLDDIWSAIVFFVTSRETAGWATALFTLFTLVSAFKFVPEFVSDIGWLNRGTPGLAVLRLIVVLGLIALLTAACVVIMVMMMAAYQAR